MRNLFIIGMLAVAAFAAGWFKINRDGDSTTIEFNRAEIRDDTRRAIEKGREILDRRDEQFANQEQPQSNFDEQSYGPQPYGNPPAYPNQPVTNQPVTNQPVPNQPWNQNYARPAQPQSPPSQPYTQNYGPQPLPPQQGGYYQGQAPSYNDQRR
ncbi:hypothetical protein N9N28_16430 [Rubripirellula amarantea]|uniref:Uncharacterized protein n=1 Tax=Rubripirellula amarantea TaxID=2527999 RepID=A0A5C5WFW3_9BACT|nr:hypothetical protein [Rubripirellula amarantea]MDA8746214.1 hypothetical protein [Rubripirellula amarantea]TWT49417.1 hypothetical protein Pla22_46130 [Rubripirellula amarantea]